MKNVQFLSLALLIILADESLSANDKSPILIGLLGTLPVMYIYIFIQK